MRAKLALVLLYTMELCSCAKNLRCWLAIALLSLFLLFDNFFNY